MVIPRNSGEGEEENASWENPKKIISWVKNKKKIKAPFFVNIRSQQNAKVHEAGLLFAHKGTKTFSL